MVVTSTPNRTLAITPTPTQALALASEYLAVRLPLLAQLAAALSRQGRLVEAVSICDTGRTYRMYAYVHTHMHAYAHRYRLALAGEDSRIREAGHFDYTHRLYIRIY